MTCACFVVEEQTQTSRPPEELTGPKFEAFCTTTLLSESKMGGKPEKVYGNYDRNVSVQTQFCGEKLVWEFQVRQRLTGSLANVAAFATILKTRLSNAWVACCEGSEEPSGALRVSVP